MRVNIFFSPTVSLSVCLSLSIYFSLFLSFFLVFVAVVVDVCIISNTPFGPPLVRSLLRHGMAGFGLRMLCVSSVDRRLRLKKEVSDKPCDSFFSCTF